MPSMKLWGNWAWRLPAAAAHQPRDTDFTGSLLRLQGEGCDFIVLRHQFP